MRTIALLAAFAGVAAAASSSSHPQIFIHAPSAPARQHPGAISVTGAQAGAILASHLGATQNEQLPLDNTGSREWQSALARQSWSAPAGGAGRTVVVLECPKHGCAGLVPDTFADSTTLDVPNLPVNSWTSLLTTQIHRLAESLGIDAATSPAIAGLDQLIESFTGVSSWFTWVSDELRQAVKSFQKAAKDKAGDVWIAVHDEPEANAGLLTALDFLDESAKKLVGELTSMVAFTDSVVSSRSGGDAADDSPQSQCPGSRVLALHLQGMKNVAERYGESSDEYENAALLFRSTLEGTLSAYEQANPGSTHILLALPPYSQPFLKRRSAYLAPFEDASARYGKQRRSAPSAHLASRKDKRQLEAFDPTAYVGTSAMSAAADDTGDDADTPNVHPVVPLSRKCFASADDVRNATGYCSGHGVPVRGITTRTLPEGQDDCWVCMCTREVSDESGKVTSYAGEACQKKDVSSDFVLLFGSGLGLIVTLVFCVSLLARAGSAELPSTLASVSGANIKID